MKINYDGNVFINCPFDSEYAPMLHAITFAVRFLGFVPRTALEAQDCAELRLQKIQRIITESRLSIHDISRVEPAIGQGGLPRFNMPFECGLCFGAIKFGTRKNKQKKALIMDAIAYQYQKTMSDINGVDIEFHDGKPERAIANVRKFLNSNSGSARPLCGETEVIARYQDFQSELPSLLAIFKITEAELASLDKWRDFAYIVDEWLKEKGKTN
jgi:hypothetical protein